MNQTHAGAEQTFGSHIVHGIDSSENVRNAHGASSLIACPVHNISVDHLLKLHYLHAGSRMITNDFAEIQKKCGWMVSVGVVQCNAHRKPEVMLVYGSLI